MSPLQTAVGLRASSRLALDQDIGPWEAAVVVLNASQDSDSAEAPAQAEDRHVAHDLAIGTNTFCRRDGSMIAELFPGNAGIIMEGGQVV